MSQNAWLLRVLRAFRDEMNSGKPAKAPDAYIGWPHRAMNKGPYAMFVWFAADPIRFEDGREIHDGAEVVTGIVFFKDEGKVSETELEQAIATYYAMRRSLAIGIEDDDSHFNSQFEGLAFPAQDKGGIRPSDGDDFDGTSVIGERWTVTGSAAAVGADEA
jgi:hypothetical protein